MILFGGRGPGRWWRWWLAWSMMVMPAVPAIPAWGQAASAPGWREANPQEYAQHLQELDGIVSRCQAQRALKHVTAGPDACDPGQVGADVRVSGAIPGDPTQREVRYDWLRTVLARADNKSPDTAPDLVAPLTGVKKKQNAPSIDELLAEARQRLQADERQASGDAATTADYGAERQRLNAILAQRAYQNVHRMTTRERFMEWFYNQLDKLLSSLIRLGMRSPWVKWTLRIGLLLAIGIALVWMLVRIERRSYIKLIPDVEAAPGAPSARQWQLWLKDAQAMAADGRWREAIHFVYWASIARLESRRLWPADRARTPREYLRLMPANDERATSLIALTRSFERTWYGGRDAASADYDAALQQAAALGVSAE